MRRMKSLQITFLGLGLALLTGCSTSPPSQFYTMTPMEPPSPIADRASMVAVGLGPVRLPEYLDRPQIVTRTDQVRLHLDEFERWGGSLREEFLRTLSVDLAILLDTDRVILYPNEERIDLDYRVALDILRLDGQVGGQSALIVRWVVLDGETGDALGFRQSAITVPVSGSGYEGIVLAKSKAVELLSKEIAEEITRLRRPGSAR